MSDTMSLTENVPIENSSSIKHSETMGKLAEALAKAQLNFVPIAKNIENVFYTTDKRKAMYADLAAIINSTQKSLAENGLVIIQSPVKRVETKEAGVQSLLLHSSGEWLQNEILLPATAKVKQFLPPPAKQGEYMWGEKFDAQTCGSAITYARRYSYQSLVGVSAEEDDGGNSIGEAVSGSKAAALEIAKAKVKGKVENSIAYIWNDESQTATIFPGSDEVKKACVDILKPLWNPTAGALVANAEQLEGLKYSLEQKNVPLKRHYK